MNTQSQWKLEKKQIIIYGWTFLAEQFLYQYSKNERSTQFELHLGGGIKLVAAELPAYWYGTEMISEEMFWSTLGDYKSSDTYIYIAYPFSSSDYKKIKSRLESDGFEEFTDFLSAEAYGRKMALINANCHAGAYVTYLRSSKTFCEEYYIYPLGTIQDRNPVEIPDVILKNCCLYIHQIISEDNPFTVKISDEYVYSRLSQDCRKLAVPNLGGGLGDYEMFYFPQLWDSNLNHPQGSSIFGIFPRRDMLIEECLFMGYGIEKMLDYYTDEDLIPHEITQRGFHEFLNVIRKAEEKWDVKISDYIENNHQYRILAALFHPGKAILAEIGKRILCALGIEEDVSFNLEFVDEYPVLSCVSKALGIEQSEFIRDGINRKTIVLCDKRMDLKEYIRQYIYWVHEYEFNLLYSKIYHIIQDRNFIMYRPTGYMRQVLYIMGESLTDSLDCYQPGIPVIILTSLLSGIKVRDCINTGVAIDDIYMIETRDQRKLELARLIYEYPKVIIYGMGNDFKFLIDEVSDRIAICDKKITEDGLRDGIEYMTVDTLINYNKDKIVYVTSTMYGNEIRDELAGKGFPKENIVLNETSIDQTYTILSQAEVVPLVQSQIWVKENRRDLTVGSGI